ncbi:hypothetical protein VQ03_18215 [Methylobacterium tarhaniae]|uniref:Uncharacterized protein n=1 Tax=Methylobacterium tarhaniae TaxID=1187852 RepID=A0A0J6VG10_9HYPH|nr:hypothetical protein [Methylobacterium tarhaniae]KMO37991.1 hypothetical protein VQ03_18215 [Methylobacterium tarhaniae]
MTISIPTDLEYLPVHRYARSPRQQTAFERREAARRKAEQRERQREAGVPDPTSIERAIVDALRLYLMKHPPSIDPVELLRYARDLAMSRSYAAHEANPSKPKFERAAVVEAIRKRVLTPPKSSRTAP